MENIILHIEKLLVANDHVVVPGLGAFVLQRQPARFVEGRVTPPFTTIGFNSLIHNADGMLALEVSRSNSISYRKAVQLIEKEVVALRDALKKAKTVVVVGRLGHLSLDANGQMLFRPAERASFLPANMGRTDIYLARSTKKSTQSKSVNRMMKYAAVLLVALSLLFPSSVNDQQQVIRANFNVLKSVDLQEIVVTPAPATAHEAPAIVENKACYKVVLAVFQSESTALKMQQKLAQSDYPHAEVDTTGNNAKVVAATFDNLVDAVNYMELIRHTDSRYAQAWVLRL